MNILFSGCSHTEGYGLDNGKDDVNNYCNVLTSLYFGTDAKIKNIGTAGHSNLRIFLDTCFELSQNTYDLAFVTWTSYPKLVSWLGIEEYECKRCFMPNNYIVEHNGNDIQFSSKFLNDLNNNLSLISNDHYEILDIVQYCNLLQVFSKQTDIFFINNSCTWDLEYFTHVKDFSVEKITSYTKKLLNVTNRDVDQVQRLYHKIHNDYHAKGGIREKQWLNLYKCFRNFRIDLAKDNLHLGPKSHRAVGEFLAKEFSLRYKT